MTATWLVVWYVITGIWAACFVVLVVVSIAESVRRSRNTWRQRARK
jgi:hypothetical protein